MHNSFENGNISTMLDACLSLDKQHLKQQTTVIYNTVYGLDNFVDEKRRTLLHILALHHEFENWDVIISCFVNLDVIDGVKKVKNEETKERIQFQIILAS